MAVVLDSCEGRSGSRRFQALIYDDAPHQVRFVGDVGLYSQKEKALPLYEFRSPNESLLEAAKRFAEAWFEQHKLVFFGGDVMQGLVHQVLDHPANMPREDSQVRWHYCVQVLGLLYKFGERFDEAAGFSIVKCGHTLVDMMRQFVGGAYEVADQIFIILYRIAKEVETAWWIDDAQKVEFIRLMTYVEEQFERFPEHMRNGLHYARYMQVADLCMGMIKHPGMGYYQKYEETLNTASKLRNEWEKDLNAKLAKVNALALQVERQQSGLHFVRLVKAFRNLLETKQSEARKNFMALIVLAFLIIAPLLFAVTNFNSVEKISSNDAKLIFLYLLPLASYEFLMIYFFRVVLSSYRATKAQMLQIELRQALCQFIEGYADFAKRVKDQSNVTLDKFETLIFANLVSEPGAIPGTFDGMEQLANLIGKARGS